jgi:hypothetical protein
MAHSIFLIWVLLLGLLILNRSNTQAQILNIERNKIENMDTTHKFFGNMSANLAVFNRSADADNPVNLLNANLNANLAYLSKQVEYMFIQQNAFTRINEDVFLNNGYSHFRVKFYRRRNTNFELFAQHQYDNFRGLEPRVLVGSGLRATLINNESTTFRIGIGGMYEYEAWRHPKPEFGVYARNLFKSTNYLLLRRKPNSHIDYNAIVYFQTGYDPNPGVWRHRYNLDANLNVAVTQKLHLVISGTLGYETRPIVPITRLIYSLTNGVRYSF